MERFLSLLERPPRESIVDKEKLKYFFSKVPIWEYFSITEQAHKSSSAKKKQACSIDIIKGFIKKIMCFFVFCFVWLFVVCIALSGISTDFALDCVILITLGPVNTTTTTINSSVSDAIKKSGQISLTKNIVLPEQNIETTIVTTRFQNGNGKSATCVLLEYGYFK